MKFVRFWGLTDKGIQPGASLGPQQRFVHFKQLTSHAIMELFDSSSELSRLEEDDEVKDIISNIGR